MRGGFSTLGQFSPAGGGGASRVHPGRGWPLLGVSDKIQYRTPAPMPDEPKDVGPGSPGPGKLAERGERPLSAKLRDAVRATVGDAASDNTKRAYATAWGTFKGWCERNGRIALPASAETVAAFLVDVAPGYKVGSLATFCSAIGRMHRDAGIDPPPSKAGLVLETLAGLRRQMGTEQERKSPLRPAHLKKIVEHAKTSARDKAALLLGYAAALRESELCALRESDLRFTDDGVLLRLSGIVDGDVKRTKTDQQGEGSWKAVRFGIVEATCPVRALKLWLDVRAAIWKNTKHVTVFGIGERTVDRIVKRAVKSIGEDPALYAGHSMRAGFVTEMRARKRSDVEIMAVTGHERAETLGIYDRPEERFQKVPEDIGL